MFISVINNSTIFLQLKEWHWSLCDIRKYPLVVIFFVYCSWTFYKTEIFFFIAENNLKSKICLLFFFLQRSFIVYWEVAENVLREEQICRYQWIIAVCTEEIVLLNSKIPIYPSQECWENRWISEGRDSGSSSGYEAFCAHNRNLLFEMALMESFTQVVPGME